MINGVKLPDELIEETKEINIDDVVYSTEDCKRISDAQEYPIFCFSFQAEYDESYITVMPTDDKYFLMDGLKRLLMRRDYLHQQTIRAAVMKPTQNMKWSDISIALRNNYEEKSKGLQTDLDRLDKTINIFKAYESKPSIADLSRILELAISSVYRLIKIKNNTPTQLLEICLERDVSVRSLEAISTMNTLLQDGLYNKFVSDDTFIPSEKLIKLIKEEGTIFDSGTQIQTNKIPNRTLGKAKKDRAIIEKAIEHDRQRGIQIKDIKNISSKIAISNLIGKQEDAVRALENRLYKIKYEANEIDIARIQNVVLRLNEVIELLRENQSSD